MDTSFLDIQIPSRYFELFELYLERGFDHFYAAFFAYEELISCPVEALD